MRALLLVAVAACSAAPPTAATAGEGFVSAPIIDSHVHLAIWPVADELASRGVLGVVDLASPTIVVDPDLDVISSGPMLTRPDGYPLDSWGADGYGIGCGDAACIAATIDRLADRGARVVKIALDRNGLDPSLVPAAVDAAHARTLKVAVHALTDQSAMLAAHAGADVLAHTPVEPLRAETISAWKGRAVISTLAAFGGSDAAIENLRALRAAGATILYGTDLGNLRDAGPIADEIALLGRAGLDAAAIVEAMTTVPAAYWAFSFGQGARVVLDRDPKADPRAFLTPREVWLRGRRLR